MSGAFIIGARRTAVVPRNGAFAALQPHELAAPVVDHLLRETGVAPDSVGELIVSNALGGGGNVARVVGLASGLPASVGGLSIDRQCAGGLDVLLVADAMIRAGQHDIVIAGGVESYSRRPLRYETYPDGREPQFFDQARFTPWPDRDPDMAQAAHRLGVELGVDQTAQDSWAMDSHAKALASAKSGKSGEITPVSGMVSDPFTRPLGPRHCAKARRICGSITVANMAVAADAAAFVVMVSKRAAAEFNAPAVEVTAGASMGGDPERPGLAPVAAIERVLNRAQIVPSEIVAAEIMEAFAVQAIACQRGAGLDHAIVNRNGGALARGHPVGASGTILAVSLYHMLVRQGGTGLAAIAAAGGLGSAMIARAC